MTIEELEQLTREYITNTYKRKYIDRIDIIKLDPVGYSVKIGRGVSYHPYVIYAELPDEKFIPLLKKEIRNLKLQYIDYGKLTLRYPYNECNDLNTSCYCDKGRVN